MFDPEGHLRAHDVLERALQSTSRMTRLRAVSMLARYACGQRERWLEAACQDPDEGVRHTALAVLAWSVDGAGQWPDREDPAFDRVPSAPAEVAAWGEPDTSGEGWHYVLEVWRHDGLLVGVYFAATRSDDDEHARRMALGQAILATVGPGADRFDPATAAVFIVDKRRAGTRARTPGDAEAWGAESS